MENSISFEYAMETLEGIVERLENGEESLEGMTRLYQEGKKLIGICKSKLDDAEKTLANEDGTN